MRSLSLLASVGRHTDPDSAIPEHPWGLGSTCQHPDCRASQGVPGVPMCPQGTPGSGWGSGLLPLSTCGPQDDPKRQQCESKTLGEGRQREEGQEGAGAMLESESQRDARPLGCQSLSCPFPVVTSGPQAEAPLCAWCFSPVLPNSYGNHVRLTSGLHRTAGH